MIAPATASGAASQTRPAPAAATSGAMSISSEITVGTPAAMASTAAMAKFSAADGSAQKPRAKPLGSGCALELVVVDPARDDDAPHARSHVRERSLLPGCGQVQGRGAFDHAALPQEVRYRFPQPASPADPRVERPV